MTALADAQPLLPFETPPAPPPSAEEVYARTYTAWLDCLADIERYARTVCTGERDGEAWPASEAEWDVYNAFEDRRRAQLHRELAGLPWAYGAGAAADAEHRRRIAAGMFRPGATP